MLKGQGPENYFGHPMFYKIIEELKEIHSEKNRQYATVDNPLGNFERTGKMIEKFLHKGVNPTLASCLSLMSKQVDGVYEIVGEGKENTVDSLEDKLRDVAIYSIIAIIILKESMQKGVPNEQLTKPACTICGSTTDHRDYRPACTVCGERNGKHSHPDNGISIFEHARVTEE